jgi:RND family efflux transporter MFP subunit
MNDHTLTRAAPPVSPEHDHVPVHDVRPLPGRAILFLAIAAAALLAGLFLLGWLPHSARMRAAAATAARAGEAKAIVEVVSPRRADRTEDLTLPGDVRADRATSVYARIGGYLKPLPPGIDIGARVAAGQLLAEISAPEVDADLERARAALVQANAAVQRTQDDLAFQQTTFKRYEGFAAEGGITAQQLAEHRQQLDNATTALSSAQANAVADTAAQKRLEEMVAFERVTAPFAGVLTYRAYDPGALISTTDIGPGKELFRIVAADVVRVHVSVPQAYAASVRIGQDAELLLRNGPVRSRMGKVARSAQAIDQASRTMQIEVDVENADSGILPGAYGQVRLRIEREHPGWVLPSSVLLIGSQGTRIALVQQGHIHLQKIAIDNDYGTTIDAGSGFDGSEQIVNNPGERLTEGLEVSVRQPPAKDGKAAEHPK